MPPHEAYRMSLIEDKGTLHLDGNHTTPSTVLVFIQ